MTFLGITTPFYGGGQVKNPANVIPTSGAPSANLKVKLGTIAVDNATGTIYGAASLSGGTTTWAILGGGTGAVATLTGDTGTATPSGGNIKIAGTTNQITTAASGATVTLSLPSAITAPGSLTTTTTLSATTTVTAGTGITATTGNIAASAGNVNATGNVVAAKSAAGATVSVQATNSDNTNTASHAQVQIAVGGTSGGNPSLLWQVSGAAADDWSAGPDRANSYRWCLSDGDVVGTTDRLRVSHTTGNFEVVSGDATVTTGNVIINGAAKQLRTHGGAVTDFIGQAVLVNGTVDVANTNIAATDRVIVTRSAKNTSTAYGEFLVTITAATKFNITACKPADTTTETNDQSTVDYFIIRQV